MANQSETPKRDTKETVIRTNLPVIVSAIARPDTPNTNMFRYSLPSSFASQLVASKLRMGQQRTLRRAPTSVAMEAYRAANSRKVKRMPAGYNRALSA